MATKKSGKGRENLVYNLRDYIETIKGKIFSSYFINPVDEVRDTAPNYFVIIKHPMDMFTMLVLSSNLPHPLEKTSRQRICHGNRGPRRL